jgi:phosphopantetheinyl transferase
MKTKIFSSDQVEVWIFSGLGSRGSSQRKQTRDQVIADFIGVDPSSLSFAMGRNSRPRLQSRDGDGMPGALEFSTSHAPMYSVVALSRGAAVGVDISYEDEAFDFKSVVDEFFSVRERRHLMSQPESERRTEFFRIWSRKEAFVKCNGLGLHCRLDEVEVLEPIVPIKAQPSVNGREKKIQLISCPDFPKHQISIGLSTELESSP